MSEQLLVTYMQKGFFAAIGFIFTSFFGLLMFILKHNKESRNNIHKKIEQNANKVLENHPTKDEFKIAFKALEKQINNMGKSIDKRIDSLQDDIREIRERL